MEKQKSILQFVCNGLTQMSFWNGENATWRFERKETEFSFGVILYKNDYQIDEETHPTTVPLDESAKISLENYLVTKHAIKDLCKYNNR